MRGLPFGGLYALAGDGSFSVGSLDANVSPFGSWYLLISLFLAARGERDGVSPFLALRVLLARRVRVEWIAGGAIEIVHSCMPFSFCCFASLSLSFADGFRERSRARVSTVSLLWSRFRVAYLNFELVVRADASGEFAFADYHVLCCSCLLRDGGF